MTRSEKDAAITELSTKIFVSMLEEIVLDTAIKAYKSEKLCKGLCYICKARDCNHITSSGTSGTSTQSTQEEIGPSQTDSTTKSDGNANIDCVNCTRTVASNRFAQHLATCLGLGTGVRRAAPRTAVTKTKTADGRSASPYVEEAIDEPKPTKSKSKSKAKQTSLANGDEMTGSLKRPGTPLPSPPKKQRKGNGPPSSVFGTGPPRALNRLGLPGSNPKGVKTRATPTPSQASHVSKETHSRSPSTDSDSSSGDGSAVDGESTLSGPSPVLPSMEALGRSRAGSNANSIGAGSSGSGTKKKVTGTGPPSRPPAVPLQRPSTEPLAPPAPVKSSYLLEMDGDETGSDTD